MKRKTSKSVSKRIKITRTGKIIRRAMGVNHFRTRKNQNLLRGKTKNRLLDHSLKQILNY